MEVPQASSCKFLSMLTAAQRETDVERKIAEAKAIAVDALRRENEERLLADARLAAELDAELLKEEQMRKAEAEQDAVFAAALFEEDRVLLEKMAGNETADKHYARKLQKDEVKSVTSLSSKLLKSWKAPKLAFENLPTGLLISTQLPCVGTMTVEPSPSDAECLDIKISPDLSAVVRFANEIPKDLLPAPFQLTVDVKIIGFRSAAGSGAVTTAYDIESNKVSIFIPGAKLERSAEDSFASKLKGFFRR